MNLELENSEESEGRLERFINKFDKDRDGKLNYLEFTRAITPKNHAYIKNSYRYDYS